MFLPPFDKKVVSSWLEERISDVAIIAVSNKSIKIDVNLDSHKYQLVQDISQDFNIWLIQLPKTIFNDGQSSGFQISQDKKLGWIYLPSIDSEIVFGDTVNIRHQPKLFVAFIDTNRLGIGPKDVCKEDWYMRLLGNVFDMPYAVYQYN